MTVALKDLIEQARFGDRVLANPLGNIYYVDSNVGADGNDGLSLRHPVATLSRAIALASAGDTIICVPGGGETVTATVAVNKARLKIICPVANPASGYTITGAGSVDLLTVSAADVHLEGIKFARAVGAGSTTAGVLTTAAADRLVVKRCSFDYTALSSSWTNYGVEITDDCDDVRIEGCVFLDCHRGVLFATATAKTCKRPVIKGCEFYVGQATAFGIFAAPDGTGVVQGIQILDNVFLEADGDGSTATDAWDGTDGTDATVGPISFDGDVDQSCLVAGNRAYTALTVPFKALNAVNASALVDWVGNKAGEDDRVQTATGTTDIDISEAVYTGFVTLLTIAPKAGHPLKGLTIALDANKATTGLDAVATASDTFDVVIVGTVDGTNYRLLAKGDQITANGDESLEMSENGWYFQLGDIPPAMTVRAMIKLSAERADAEVPYRVTWIGAAPTITAVAAA